MPRRFRIPEGLGRRLLLASGIILPLVLYTALRAIPVTRGWLLSNEARVVRITTRIGDAFRYVVLNKAFEENELLVCTQEKEMLAAQVSTLLYTDAGPVRNLPVQVVARAYGGDGQHVLVWNASSEPFVVGEAVGTGRILLGTVIEAKNDLAVVQLVTHEASALPAMVSNKEATIGIASGTGGSWMEFSYVPKGSDVHVGDVVVTSGLGGNMLRGLVLGTVREVIDADPSPFYRIKMEPLVYGNAWWEAEVLHLPVL